ncbi:Anoctamin-4 [Desmophyllum pertusum]|uniref:Anoctamin n=1 Tax=Desmophyllum pertusum TaxID=174260 RepID=A0A9W9YJS2_9CNID|nr:Anoctamin-4 [Desmophyllum pertusum]
MCDEKNRNRWYMCPMCDQFWKRRQATLAQKWHTSEFEEEEEEFRPEYLSSLTDEEINPYKPDPRTGKIGPNVFKIKQFRRMGFVFSVIAFMILLVIAAMIGVVVYRATIFCSFKQQFRQESRGGCSDPYNGHCCLA